MAIVVESGWRLQAQPSAGTFIRDLPLVCRSHNILKRAGIETVEQLQGMSMEQLASIRNFGIKLFREINEVLQEPLEGTDKEFLTHLRKHAYRIRLKTERLREAELRMKYGDAWESHRWDDYWGGH
ncbi:MAG: DNA-directed RNA polymerase subunit alpha C-terminal domain-containing protein [Dehalococcoidia bacterium]